MKRLHYNYTLQAWIDRDGYVMACGHKEGAHLCTACELEGFSESDALEELGHI